MLPLLCLLFLTASAGPTIPSSREYPTSDSCHLSLPDDFFRAISAACSPPAPARRLCCPALAAWLLAAYSDDALATRVQPSAVRNDFPVLPGDTEPCAAAAEAALRARGVEILGANDTCGAASCTCGVVLHPLQCSGPFEVGGGGEGRWVPKGDVAESLEVGCAGVGVEGCDSCLKVIYELKSKDSSRGSSKGEHVKDERECQLMGLTWLLAKNRTRYLPTATYVLQAFREAGGSGYPTSCSTAGDGTDVMPLPVGSGQLLGTASFAGAGRWSPPTSLILFFFLAINFLLKISSAIANGEPRC